MKKSLLAFVLVMFNLTSYACSRALPTDDPGFCASFKAVAICYCASSGVPAGMCQDINALYNRMLVVFGSLQKACEYQHHTSVQDCMDNWNCYMHGGIDSRGRACSSNQRACQ